MTIQDIRPKKASKWLLHFWLLCWPIIGQAQRTHFGQLLAGRLDL